MKRDPKGTPGQRWAAEVEYRGPQECDALHVDKVRRCAKCHFHNWDIGARRDGGTLVKIVCAHPSVPDTRSLGLKVAEKGNCNRWERSHVD